MVGIVTLPIYQQQICCGSLWLGVLISFFLSTIILDLWISVSDNIMTCNNKITLQQQIKIGKGNIQRPKQTFILKSPAVVLVFTCHINNTAIFQNKHLKFVCTEVSCCSY